MRGSASLAAVTATILAGAHLVRVHDVRESREVAAIADAILAARFEGTPTPSRTKE
jgi:dihydropteroate synthase